MNSSFGINMKMTKNASCLSQNLQPVWIKLFESWITVQTPEQVKAGNACHMAFPK